MQDPNSKVIPLSDQNLSAGSGNGGKFDDRLRAVENRLTAIETKMENVATKTDIERLRVWALGGALVGVLAVVSWLVYWILRNIPAGV